MTYGTSANTYLVGRRPSRSSPHRRSRTVPIGKGPAIQHMRRGLIALTAHFAHFYLARHPPNQPQRLPPKRAARETSFASAAWKPATHRGKMLKLINDHLDHLHETKDLFDHLARSPCPIAPRIRQTRERRNVTSSMRLRLAQGLNSLSSLSSHISTGNTTPALPPRRLYSWSFSISSTRSLGTER